MERLTEKCWRNLDPWECCGQDKYCQRGCHDEGGCTNGCKVPKMYCKLAKYEDLEEQCIAENQCGIRELLTKWKAFFDDIEKLCDYRKAEEQGLLLRLPVLPKPGMKIYDIYGVIENGETEPREITIRSFNITHARMWYFHINNEVFTFDDFGKTYFLTREEAESALAEKGGEE